MDLTAREDFLGFLKEYHSKKNLPLFISPIGQKKFRIFIPKRFY
ncbi:hypothetical protein LEP1GSC115_2208 [Leptospira interrogans serovar Australis str. 200703203]|uniref:Uncharacterized protein n=1 Tax=Leptospira interrogans serovar Australis str. 200703203 TaxID=1085541 RepID=N1UJS1_LEPIR|nr:hypothetical protein LEP1GSC115_2208 [Leptospira interrogans serovar Australis str. 200703203]